MVVDRFGGDSRNHTAQRHCAVPGPHSHGGGAGAFDGPVGGRAGVWHAGEAFRNRSKRTCIAGYGHIGDVLA